MAFSYDLEMMNSFLPNSTGERLMAELSKIALTKAFEADLRSIRIKNNVSIFNAIILLQQIIDLGGIDQLISSFSSVKVTES